MQQLSKEHEQDECPRSDTEYNRVNAWELTFRHRVQQS